MNIFLEIFTDFSYSFPCPCPHSSLWEVLSSLDSPQLRVCVGAEKGWEVEIEGSFLEKRVWWNPEKGSLHLLPEQSPEKVVETLKERKPSGISFPVTLRVLRRLKDQRGNVCTECKPLGCGQLCGFLPFPMPTAGRESHNNCSTFMCSVEVGDGDGWVGSGDVSGFLQGLQPKTRCFPFHNLAWHWPPGT